MSAKFPRFAPLDPDTPAPRSLLGVPAGGNRVTVAHHRDTATLYEVLLLAEQNHSGLRIRLTNTHVHYEIDDQVPYGEIHHDVELDLP